MIEAYQRNVMQRRCKPVTVIHKVDESHKRNQIVVVIWSLSCTVEMCRRKIWQRVRSTNTSICETYDYITRTNILCNRQQEWIAATNNKQQQQQKKKWITISTTPSLCAVLVRWTLETSRFAVHNTHKISIILKTKTQLRDVDHTGTSGVRPVNTRA